MPKKYIHQLTNSELLKEVNPVLENEIAEFLFLNKYDGQGLTNLKFDKLQLLLTDEGLTQYFNFIRKLKTKYSIQSSLNTETSKTPQKSNTQSITPRTSNVSHDNLVETAFASATSYIDINRLVMPASPTMSNQTLTDDPNMISSNSQGLELIQLDRENTEPSQESQGTSRTTTTPGRWPKRFVFPTHRISDALKQKLHKEEELSNSEEKELITALYNEIISYNIIYPEHWQYLAASQSLLDAFKHLALTETTFKDYMKKLKNKFINSRNADFKDHPDKLAKKLKFTPKTIVVRSTKRIRKDPS